MRAKVTRSQVLSYRARAQQLNVESARLVDSAILDIGVQDSSHDGARWALANRGVDVSEISGGSLVRVWTTRGAPHLYLRASLPMVAAAVDPFSDADAGKRIFTASKPLKAAGISNLDALDAVAAAMRSVVTAPMAKGEVSRRLTALMDPPYLRFCRACHATHLYEMPFRLAALRAGPGWSWRWAPRHRCCAPFPALSGPACVLAADEDGLTSQTVTATRLLGPFDLFLQAGDRPTLIDDPVRAKALWPVLGRPGAVLVNGEITGLWRPRTSGRHFTVSLELWARTSAPARAAITEQAQRLAAFRRMPLSGIDFDG